MTDIASVTVARPNGLLIALSKNRLSWLGVILLALIVAMAVFAPLLAPMIPSSKISCRVCSRPRRSTGWAPTAMAAMCCRG